MATQQALRFRNLQTNDEQTVSAWLSDYLHHHISGWLSAHGLEWQADEITKHISTRGFLHNPLYVQ